MTDKAGHEHELDALLNKHADCFYKEVLGFVHVGILVASTEGTIKYMNPTFAKMFDIPLPGGLNTDICDYFPNSRLLEVMRDGVADEGTKFSYKGQDALISRFPLVRNGVVIGGLIEVYFRDITELTELLDKMDSLKKKVHYYERKSQGLPGARYTFDDLVGGSAMITELKKRGRKFARSAQPVLILGESGAGKELVAHGIHAASLRSAEIFVRINCAAIPKDLLESELFGYEDGTFTGAVRGGKVGKFELADRGTIFLDEIGELPLEMQSKLLRVIENKEIQKIGKSTPIYSDFRLIAATNKDLAKEVEASRFREDLFHRLSILVLDVPPLRKRPEDIPMITRHFLDTLEDTPLTKVVKLSEKVKNVFMVYPWPGNIRELKNVLSFALLSLDEGTCEMTLRHLPPYILEKGIPVSSPPPPASGHASLSEARETVERDTILSALKETGDNKSQAAKILGISRNELYKKLKKHGMNSKE